MRTCNFTKKNGLMAVWSFTLLGDEIASIQIVIFWGEIKIGYSHFTAVLKEHEKSHGKFMVLFLNLTFCSYHL